jgi:hypothetical protein
MGRACSMNGGRRGMRQRIWLRHYATSRKVEDSSPDEMDFFFLNLPNPSSHIIAFWSTQPVTEMSNRSLPGEQRSAGA